MKDVIKGLIKRGGYQNTSRGKRDRKEFPKGKSLLKTAETDTGRESKEASKGKRLYAPITGGEPWKNIPSKRNYEEEDCINNGCLPQGRKYISKRPRTTYVRILRLIKDRRHSQRNFTLVIIVMVG